MESRKILKSLLVGGFCLVGIVAAGTVLAEDDNVGWYLGGALNVLVMEGTGTWDDKPFDFTWPLNDETTDPIGLNWGEKIMFGAKPVVGYRFIPQLALQVGYSFLLPKNSAQSYTESGSNYTYEQRMDVEWKQRSIEINALYFPSRNLKIYLFGGVDLVHAETSVIFTEGAEFTDWTGAFYTGDHSTIADHVSAVGAIFGGGIELPSEDAKYSTFFSIQYSTATTDNHYFDFDDFQVNVGGVSFMGGIKWYPAD